MVRNMIFLHPFLSLLMITSGAHQDVELGDGAVVFLPIWESFVATGLIISGA